MSRSGSYRLVAAAVALCACAPLLAAGAAAAPPVSTLATPRPVPTAAATIAPAFAPAVLVYPFEVGGDLKADAGAAIAQTIDQQLALGGGLSVLPTPNGVARKDYLSNARGLKADYYISGYLTPVGDGASLVMQLVSTQSGIMVYSKTAQIYTAQDASAQAFSARQVMIARSGAGEAAVDDTGSATPQPTATQGANVSIGGLGSILNIFHRPKKNTPPNATALAEADKPDRVVLVSRLVGTADAAALGDGTNALKIAMDRFYRTRAAGTPVDGGKNANAICGANRNATIASGSLSQSTSGGFRKRTQSTFVLAVYTCFGATLYKGEPATAGSVGDAVNQAVEAYAKAHPDNG